MVGHSGVERVERTESPPMEEIQLEPRDLSGASKLTLEGQTIVVHHKKNPTVFPLAGA